MTPATITVSGTLEIFGVVPAGSVTRPAIDGGHTGGRDSYNGHTVFKVTGDATTLMIWLRARAPKMCCQWKKHRSRRESNMELLPASDYSIMDDVGE